MSEKAWYRFCVNAEGGVPDYFEKELCKRFFAIQNNIELEMIENPQNYPGVENVPVNELAYQSKWGGDWSDQMDSLKMIEKKHSTYYPQLKKVIFYVEKISSSESLERNTKGGVFDRLKELGVEVEFFGKDAIYNLIHKDPQYRDLRKYFVNPIDEGKLLNLAERYINELFIEDARMVLDIVFSRFDGLSDGQKFIYYKLLGNLRCYDLDDSGNYEEEYLEACKYEKGTSRAEILYSIAKIQQKNYEGIEELLTKIASDNFEPLAQRALLMLYNAQGVTIEEIESKIQPVYKENTDVLKMLGRVVFGKDNLKALDYFRKGYSSENESTKKFIDTMAYFQIYMAYVQEKFGLDDISIEGKQAYEELREVYESIKDMFPARSLSKKDVAHIHNFQGVVERRVFGNTDSGICLIKQALLISYEPIFEFNLAKIYQDKYDFPEAKRIYKKLLADFEVNPSRDPTIQQVVVLLAQIYTEEGDISTAISILETFNSRHELLILPHIKKGIVIALSQAMYRKGDTSNALKVIDLALAEDDNNFPCLLIKNLITGDIKYLHDAYEVAKSSSPSNLYPIYDFLQLAWKLGEHSLHEEAYNLYKQYFRNLEDKQHFERFISICILKNDYSLANDVAEHYKDLLGEDSFYIYSKASIYRRQGRYSDAISLIKSNEGYKTDMVLLFELVHLGYECTNVELIVESIRNIERHPKFGDLTISSLLEYIKFYYTYVDKTDGIKKLYVYIQKENDNSELKKLYFAILISETSIGQIDIQNINTDTIVTVKEVGSETITKISFDGYTSIGVDVISKVGELTYQKLIGKTRGEICSDIFKENPLLSKKYEIISIENKYIHLYQNDVMKHMLHAGVMEAIPVPGDDISGLLEILDKLDDAGDIRNEQFDELHKNGMLLLSILGEFTHRSIYEIYNGITQGNRWNIISDTHTKFQSENDLPNRFIIDISGILTLKKLGLLESASDNFSVYVSKSTFDFFTDEISKLEQEIPKTTSTLIKHDDGKRSMIEHTEEVKRNSIAELSIIKSWLQDSCHIEANPIFDVNKDSDTKKTLSEEYYDTLYLARNLNLVLLSDDLALRKLGRNNEIGLICLSTESLLGTMYNKEIIDVGEYCESLRKLMQLNFINLSFNTGVILNSLLHEEIETMREELDVIYEYCKKFDVDLGFILMSIFESIGNLLRHYETAKAKFSILMDIITKYYDFNLIKDMYISELDKMEASEAINRLYKLITEYEEVRKK